MRSITLTTTVRNHATLPILLRITDELVAAGLLSSLRVIDATPDDIGTESLRSTIPIDGETGLKIVTMDRQELKRIDYSAHVSVGMTSYRYKSTSLHLTPGGRSVNVMTRGSAGSYVAVSPGGSGKGPGGVEVGLEKTRCFVRSGRGGGTPSATLDVPGVVAGGLGWRSIKLSLAVDKKLTIEVDTGATMEAQLRSEENEFAVSISSPANGSSDFVVSYLDRSAFEPTSSVDRTYVSYFSSKPGPSDGLELVSDIDIVYIDKEGWRRLVENNAVPLVLGDSAHCATLRRMGILKASNSSKQVHDSFLSRSRAVIDRIEDLVFRDVPMASVVDSKIKVGNVVEGTGLPALICGLQGSVLGDVITLDRYKKLALDGPHGEKVLDHAADVVAYFDILLNSSGAEEFLLELVEAMPAEKKEFLFRTLSQKLS